MLPLLAGHTLQMPPVVPLFFVSHASDFEDVLIWRALCNVRSGFYVDVGAQPCAQSATEGFSGLGWRGVNVTEKLDVLHELVRGRPRDVNLRNHLDSGDCDRQDESLPVARLADLCRLYVPRGQDVHFLRIDAPGSESALLGAHDWTRWRPWLVVVKQSSVAREIEGWDQVLRSASYRPAYAHGPHHFWVDAARPELLAAFDGPPRISDHFVPLSCESMPATIKAQREALDDAARRLEACEGGRIEPWRRIEILETSAILARQRERATSAKAHAEAVAARESMAALQAQLAGVEHQLRTVMTSASWRFTAPLRSAISALPVPVLRLVRRAGKATWWALTPWRMPARLQARRSARASAPSASSVAGSGGHESENSEGLLAVLGLAGRRPRLGAAHGAAHGLWKPLAPTEIDDPWTAARWCLDLLSERRELQSRFPSPLTGGPAGDFAQWLQREGEKEFALSASARLHIAKAFEQDPGVRPRRVFLFDDWLRARLPHGLLPAGRMPLLSWMLNLGRKKFDLRSEEIVWLLRAAAEQPALELIRAYEFTPAWQAAHPEGLTNFGREAFVDWYRCTYGDEGDWLETSDWPPAQPASRQLRQVFHARSAWRSAHPAAFDGAPQAKAFVEALPSLLGPSDQVVLDGLLASTGRDELVRELARPGVNLIGHFVHPSGLRVSIRALAKGLRSQGLQLSLRDVRTAVGDEEGRLSYAGMEDFDVTIIHTQPAPYFPRAYELCGLHAREPRPYRIAYWYWEFEAIPNSWLNAIGDIDEVWTATEFIARGLREKLPLPVRTIFPGVELEPYARKERRDFGLPEDHFIFLFVFHMNSVMERKNPLGLIDAFKAAFRLEDRTTLVIKTMFGESHPSHLKDLLDAAVGSNVVILNEVYSTETLHALMDTCDAYVSLHRCEGLGLTMAEAMLMGKPVIATRYSGNIDFMDDNNSLLVPCEMVTLGRDIEPYDAGLSWAEPSLSRAAELMRELFDDQAWARMLGQRAQADARSRLSVETAGRKAASRLAEIRETLRAARSDTAFR